MSGQIPFYKMSGSGNDFIIIDNRGAVVDEQRLTELVRGACRRKFSVGADGLILIEETSTADFRWRFYNSDGGRAEMCGNGARCAARFAHLTGIAGREMAFETDAGVIHAEIMADGVRIRMTDPGPILLNQEIDIDGGSFHFHSVNTGVPHLVVPVADVEAVDVYRLGKQLRFHERFQPAGTNVNFVTVTPERVFIRTYERGVEDETLACGTGAVAAALTLAAESGVASPIHLQTRSGSLLSVHFEKSAREFSHVHLEGEARVIYSGLLWDEAWQ